MESQKSQAICFDKQMTSIVKGVAIVFMMLLHCYGTGAYDKPIDVSHSLLTGWNSTFKICVGIFVFMVGYGYAFSKNKDLKYSLQHIKKLLIPFWVILFVFTLPFCFEEVSQTNWSVLLYNLVGIDSHYNWYSWFVYFFIYAMGIMPFVARFINRKPVLNTAIVVCAALLLMAGVHDIPGCLEKKPLLALFNCLMMTPGMAIGYLFAHERYYEKIKVPQSARYLVALLCAALMLAVLVLRYRVSAIYGFQLDVIYAPMTIGAIVVLFNVNRWRIVRLVFSKLGEVSVYMWFFHALFFTTPVRWFYQPSITIFNDINLVVLWTIILTFCASWLVKTVVDSIQKKFVR